MTSNEPPAGVAVVTGAGSGIGKAVAERLRRSGIEVCGWDRDPDSVQWLGRGAPGSGVVVDVRDADAVAEAADRVLERFGRVDHVINCAGLFLVATLDDVRASEVQRLFDVNVLGTTLVTQALLPALRATRGSVVNVASAVAMKATPSNSHYAASKAAVAQLTRCWALELGPDGIRVNAVAPGPVATNIYSTAGMSGEATEQLLSSRVESLALRRSGSADHVAEWIYHLAVDSQWVTGQVLAVDGGMSVG